MSNSKTWCMREDCGEYKKWDAFRDGDWLDGAEPTEQSLAEVCELEGDLMLAMREGREVSNGAYFHGHRVSLRVATRSDEWSNV